MVQPQLYNNTSSSTVAIFSNSNTAANGTNIVEVENFNLDANLFNINIPGSNIDSGININLGLLPKRRTFLVSGQFQGTEAQIGAFIKEIEDIAKESFPDELRYRSSWYDSGTPTGQYYARINGFTYTRDQATYNILTYTVEFYTDAA